MLIRTTANIRQNYNRFADLCRTSQEPVLLTKNGKRDLVVLDINLFTNVEKMTEIIAEIRETQEAIKLENITANQDTQINEGIN